MSRESIIHFRCDRCGATQSRAHVGQSNEDVAGWGIGSFISTAEHNRVSVDLCPKCYDEFTSWLSAKAMKEDV